MADPRLFLPLLAVISDTVNAALAQVAIWPELQPCEIAFKGESRLTFYCVVHREPRIHCQTQTAVGQQQQRRLNLRMLYPGLTYAYSIVGTCLITSRSTFS